MGKLPLSGEGIEDQCPPPFSPAVVAHPDREVGRVVKIPSRGFDHRCNLDRDIPQPSIIEILNADVFPTRTDVGEHLIDECIQPIHGLNVDRIEQAGKTSNGILINASLPEAVENNVLVGRAVISGELGAGNVCS